MKGTKNVGKRSYSWGAIGYLRNALLKDQVHL